MEREKVSHDDALSFLRSLEIYYEQQGKIIQAGNATKMIREILSKQVKCLVQKSIHHYFCDKITYIYMLIPRSTFFISNDHPVLSRKFVRKKTRIWSSEYPHFNENTFVIRCRCRWRGILFSTDFNGFFYYDCTFAKMMRFSTMHTQILYYANQILYYSQLNSLLFTTKYSTILNENALFSTMQIKFSTV